MNITIKATGIELTPAISAYVDKKISVVEKYLSDSPSTLARVEIGKTTNHHKEGNIYKAEVHLTHVGENTYVLAEAEDLYTAIDKVENELAHSLLSKKGRRVRLLRKGERKIKEIGKGLNFWKRAGEHMEE